MYRCFFARYILLLEKCVWSLECVMPQSILSEKNHEPRFVYLFLQIHMEDSMEIPSSIETIYLVWNYRHTFLHLLRWIYRSLIFFQSYFFCYGVSDLGASGSCFIGVNFELSSLVLRKESHPLFLVGGCTGPFLQFKCTSCMVRTIS